jgi:hypothetical protein
MVGERQGCRVLAVMLGLVTVASFSYSRDSFRALEWHSSGTGRGVDVDMRHETSGGGGTNDDSCTYGGVLTFEHLSMHANSTNLRTFTAASREQQSSARHKSMYSKLTCACIFNCQYILAHG